MTRADFNFWLVVALMFFVVVVLFSLALIVQVLPSVKRITEASLVIAALKLDVSLGPNEAISYMSGRLLVHLLNRTHQRAKTSAPYLKFPVGRLLVIAHTNVNLVKRLASELQLNAFFVAALFLFGLVTRAQDLDQISFEALRRDIGSHPLHVLDWVAAVAFIFLLFRLASEIRRLHELLVPPN